MLGVQVGHTCPINKEGNDMTDTTHYLDTQGYQDGYAGERPNSPILGTLEYLEMYAKGSMHRDAERDDNELRVKRAVLVYQAGIANVFRVDAFNMSDYGREAHLMIQADFHTCEVYARALARCGTVVRSAWCNMAGSIAACQWKEVSVTGGEGPFSDKWHPVISN